MSQPAMNRMNFDIHSLHPRPQMARQNWIDLNGEWQFLFDDAASFKSPQDISDWPMKILVPFAPETIKSGIGDTGFHKTCWYQRQLSIKPKKGKRVLLHFGAVDYEADVWVNDHFVGSHQGGHTPFSFDITSHLKADGEQTITVRAEDDPHDLAKPRGKQDWQLEAHSIWYPRTTGIWQTVWMEELNEVYIDRLKWTPHLERWEFGLEAFVKGELADEATLHIKMRNGDQLVVSDTYRVISREVHRRIALSDPGIDDFRNELLWSPEKPTLIDAELELWIGKECVDRVHSYTALRSVNISHGDFLLNGRPYYLRLVLDQGYWPESFMTAPNEDALRKDIELVKAMGFNGVRKHQKIESPNFLFWADRLGLLVWEEMPSAYRFTHDGVERLMREWTEVIDRDYSHPCIVTWVPFNESWGVPDLNEMDSHRSCIQAFYHLTKTLDPTRPVIGNDGWESASTDIIGIHDYDNHPGRLIERYGPHFSVKDILSRRIPAGRMPIVKGYQHDDQPIMLTEFGGIAFTGENRSGATKDWGYGKSHSAREFKRQFWGLVSAVHRLKLFRGFCYTQLTDTFQEANGLLYADRTPKIPIQEIWGITCSQIDEERLFRDEPESRTHV
ncbi:MAG: glycoside hydrolase family 2 [Proteobacteria bacterium]|nr:MAG: glycoside hydrolase family 2 [Pseudomonadota bacterium]